MKFFEETKRTALAKSKPISDVVWILFVVSVLAFSGYRAHLQAQNFEENQVALDTPRPVEIIKAGVGQ